VLDFKSYVKELLNFMKPGGAMMPLTATGFMVSSFSDPMMSGLSIELYNGDYGDDATKFNKYIRDPNFRFFVKAARKFGFYVDRNAPWRLIADPLSQPMIDRQGALDTSLTSTMTYDDPYGSMFFNRYYDRTYELDVKSVGGFHTSVALITGLDFTDVSMRSALKKMYNDFVTQYPRRRIQTTSSTRCSPDRAAWTNTRSPITTQEIDDFKETYWLNLYFQLRLREAKVSFQDYHNKFQMVRQLYKFHGPNALMVGSLTHAQLNAFLGLMCYGRYDSGPRAGEWYVENPEVRSRACELIGNPEEFLKAQGTQMAARYINNEIKPYLYDLQVGAKKKLTLGTGPVRIGSVKDY
jgi:hypothetical protein